MFFRETRQQPSLPPCYVVVRKLSLEEISRMTINPFYVRRSCARCKRPITFGPRCSICRSLYHHYCARKSFSCCDSKLPTFPDTRAESQCPRCKQSVKYGPQCSVCRVKYHRFCVGPYHHCCKLVLWEPNLCNGACGKCLNLVRFGPKCPLCLTVYHAKCVSDHFECCGVKFTQDNNARYQCRRCQKRLSMGSPMCTMCGQLTHAYCLNRARNSCCGRKVPLEIYLIPSYKYLAAYYRQFERRRAILNKIEKDVASHSHQLRSKWKNSIVTLAPPLEPRTKKRKSVSSQTNALENVALVEMKMELEEKELDIAESPPPVLEREESPEPTSSSHMAMPDIVDAEDSLKNLFDFLYKMVRKFPPHLQTQVKIDLFKIVTEAEMKCNMPQ